MATTTGSQVATQLLRDLNAPVTTATVRAVSIWLAFESGNRIVGNNPWNITGTGNCGYRTYNSRKFAVYCSLNDGIAASARLLTNYSGYSGIVSALRSESAYNFFVALVKSPWDGGHYAGAGGVAGLWQTFLGSYNYGARVYTLITPTTTGGGTSTGGTGGTVSSTSNQWTDLLDKWIKPYINTTTWNGAFDKAYTAASSQGVDSAIIGGLQNVVGVTLQALGINVNSTISSTDYTKVRNYLLDNPGTGSLDLNPLDAIGSAIKGVGDAISYVFLFIAFILVGIVLLLIGAKVSGNIPQGNS